jgi:S-layer protein
MAYTFKQLTMAHTALHDGIEPDAQTASSLKLFTNASFGDAAVLSELVNTVDGTTALAVLSYQFFTGKSPTKAGLDYLVNSADNAPT